MKRRPRYRPPVHQEETGHIQRTTEQLDLYQALATQANALRVTASANNRLAVVSIAANVERMALEAIEQVCALKDAFIERQHRRVSEQISPGNVSIFADQRIKEQDSYPHFNPCFLWEGLRDSNRRSFSGLFKEKGLTLGSFGSDLSYLFDEEATRYILKKAGNIYWYWYLIRCSATQHHMGHKKLPITMGSVEVALKMIRSNLTGWFPAYNFVDKIDPSEWPAGIASVAVLNKTLMIRDNHRGLDQATLVLNPLLDQSPVEPAAVEAEEVEAPKEVAADNIDWALKELREKITKVQEQLTARVNALATSSNNICKKDNLLNELLVVLKNFDRALSRAVKDASAEQDVQIWSKVSRADLFGSIRTTDFERNRRNRLHPNMYSVRESVCSVRTKLEETSGCWRSSLHGTLSVFCTERAVELIEANCFNSYWLNKVLYHALSDRSSRHVRSSEKPLPLKGKDIKAAIKIVSSEEDWSCIPFHQDPSTWDPAAVMLAIKDGLILLTHQTAKVGSTYDASVMMVNPLFL